MGFEEEEKESMKTIPRGRPKSGRLWKSERIGRHSEIKKDKPLRNSWAVKMAMKAEKKSVKQYELGLKAERRKEIEDKKKRRETNEKNRLENEKKAEVVQKIKNPAKLKKMKKKQLRSIAKR